jgi:hypothetical protein
LNKNKAVRLCGGLALAVGVSLVPMGAMASNHAPAPARAGAPGAAGHHDHMAGAAAAGHHGATAAHHSAMPAAHAAPPARHAAPAAHHAPPKAKAYVHKMAPKRDTGSVEGGSGAADNDGGSITGEHAPAHVHGDNQGGDIH